MKGKKLTSILSSFGKWEYRLLHRFVAEKAQDQKAYLLTLLDGFWENQPVEEIWKQIFGAEDFDGVKMNRRINMLLEEVENYILYKELQEKQNSLDRNMILLNFYKKRGVEYAFETKATAMAKDIQQKPAHSSEVIFAAYKLEKAIQHSSIKQKFAQAGGNISTISEQLDLYICHEKLLLACSKPEILDPEKASFDFFHEFAKDILAKHKLPFLKLLTETYQLKHKPEPLFEKWRKCAESAVTTLTAYPFFSDSQHTNLTNIYINLHAIFRDKIRNSVGQSDRIRRCLELLGELDTWSTEEKVGFIDGELSLGIFNNMLTIRLLLKRHGLDIPAYFKRSLVTNSSYPEDIQRVMDIQYHVGKGTDFLAENNLHWVSEFRKVESLVKALNSIGRSYATIELITRIKAFQALFALYVHNKVAPDFILKMEESLSKMENMYQNQANSISAANRLKTKNFKEVIEKLLASSGKPVTFFQELEVEIRETPLIAQKAWLIEQCQYLASRK